MAGEWMPTRLDLHDDPAVIGIAMLTGLDVDAVVGKLVRFWSWANRHLPNGHARGVTESWLAAFLNSEKFPNAMCSMGWLTLKSGELFIPKYDRWNSQSAKRRLLESRRKSKNRVRIECGQNADKMRTRVEKSREEKNGESKTERDMFVPPTVDQVREFCAERGNSVDPVKFVAFYEAKNWKIGKNKMVKWRSAVITWERNGKDRKTDGQSAKPITDFEKAHGTYNAHTGFQFNTRLCDDPSCPACLDKREAGNG